MRDLDKNGEKSFSTESDIEIKMQDLISNFIISQEILKLTNIWRKPEIKPKKSNDRSPRLRFLTSVIISLILVLIFSLLLLTLMDRQSNVEHNEIKVDLKENDIYADAQDTIKIPAYNYETRLKTEDNKAQKSKMVSKNKTNKFHIAANALIPPPVFIKTRSGGENTLSEKMFSYYQDRNIDALVGIQNDLKSKAIKSEYLDDLIGRLYLKKGEIDNAIELYSELCQTDSPNIEDYEFLLLLSYYAKLPNTKGNFVKLKDYISSDSLHHYFKIVTTLRDKQ